MNVRIIISGGPLGDVEVTKDAPEPQTYGDNTAKLTARIRALATATVEQALLAYPTETP